MGSFSQNSLNANRFGLGCTQRNDDLFDIFRRPTVQSQADQYPTLHNTIPNYLHMLRQLNVWQLQIEKPFLKRAASAAHEILDTDYGKSCATRNAFVATICDPRYKLNLYEYMFQAEGGAQAPLYIKGKSHFLHVYNHYATRDRHLRAHDVHAAELEEEEDDDPFADSPETEGQEEWRTNPMHGYAAHIQQQRQIAILPLQAITNEALRWLAEPILDPKSSPERVQACMAGKAIDYPIITQMARDYRAIPATSAPSERVFSCAGNLISKKRGKISSENVRYVLCLRGWGLLEEADDEEVIAIDDDGHIIPLAPPVA